MANSTADLLPNSSPNIRTVARLGFAANGFVYFCLGGLALLAATDLQGGQTADRQKVFLAIVDLPLGRWLLALVALGLAAYVVWRFVQAINDTEHAGTDAKGITKRLGYAGSGLIYAGLAYLAARTAWQGGHSGDGSSSDTRKTLVAKVLALPLGQWLVGAAALVTVGIGAYQLYKAYRGKCREEISASSLSSDQKQAVVRTGQVGYAARGIVLGIIGYFLLQAAVHTNASRVRDTEGAFDMLSTMGPLVLGIVALGLMCYGVYQLMRARYPALHLN